MPPKTHKATHSKAAMLQALEDNLSIVTKACRQVGIDRATHYRWMDEDPEYKKAVDSLSEVVLDFAESKLFSRIEEGSDTATIFFLKCKGKKRGYIEKLEIETSQKELIEAAPIFGDD